MGSWSVRLLVYIVTVCALTLCRPVFAAEFTCASGDVACLIDAINTANINGETDTITLSAGIYTLTAVNNITLDGPNGLPSVTSPLTITGAGATATILERAADAPFFRLVHTDVTGILVLNGLTLRGGAGAIANRGTLSLTNSLVAGNVNGLGAGISNDGTMTILSSTLNRGDGISNDSSMVFANSTLSGSGDISNDGTIAVTNSSVSGSGNISNDGTLTFVNSTLNSDGDISNDGTIAATNSTIAHRGNMSNDNLLTLQNTILVLSATDDCGSPPLSLGHNVIETAAGCSTILHASDRTGPPGTGPFADDGIPGHGHFPLLPGSPAIDGGDSTVCLPADQLGHTRMGVCDIGAVEFPSALLTLSLNTSEVSSGQTLILTANYLPWPTPVQGDVYILLQVPDGSFLFLQQDGSLTPAMRPLVSDVQLVPLVTELFRHTYNGTELKGHYQWFGGVAQPGTLVFSAGTTQAPFDVLP